MASGNAGSGERGGEMVWKEEEMYRWQIDADTIVRPQDVTGELPLPLNQVNFEFQQSMETGGERLSWKAWATLKKHTPLSEKRIIIGLQSLHSEGAGNKSVSEERLSLKFEIAIDTTILERGTCESSNVRIRSGGTGKRRDSQYVWIWTMNPFEKNFRTLQMAGIGIIFTFIFILKTNISTMEKIYWPSEVAIKEKFYMMMKKLENDKEKSDLKIISSDGKKFFACRWILAEVSDVFGAMFRTNMKEKQSGVLKLDDLTGTTVKTLLHFIYTGEVAREWSCAGTAEELIYAAAKYQMEELKQFLDAKVGMICTADNAGALLAMAEKTSLKKAVADILAFIREQCKNPKGFFEIVKKTKTD